MFRPRLPSRTSPLSTFAALSFFGVTVAAGCCQEAAAEGPAKPPFRQEEVSFRSGDNTLKGTLVLPGTPGPHPAVAFVHGSGALGRDDWTLHPPLREHLARHGIASLCWDKPGVGASTGDWTRQSFRDLALEALPAGRFLRGRTA